MITQRTQKVKPADMAGSQSEYLDQGGHILRSDEEVNLISCETKTRSAGFETHIKVLIIIISEENLKVTNRFERTTSVVTMPGDVTVVESGDRKGHEMKSKEH